MKENGYFKEQNYIYMKKISLVSLLSILILLLSVDMAHSQTWITLDGSNDDKDVTLNVIESNASTYKVRMSLHGFYDRQQIENGIVYHQLYMQHGSGLLNVGEPQLPTISQLIAIPEGATYKVMVEEGQWRDIEVGKIYPSQRSLLESEVKCDFIINDSIYHQDEYAPTMIRIGEEQTWHNIRNISLSACPFKYYPLENKLSILTDFVLRVDFIGASCKSSISSDALAHASRWNMFDNDIGDFPCEEDTKRMSTDKSGSYDYLIIVGDNPDILNSQALKDFQRWKAFKGYKTKVVSTTTIGTSQSSIKSYIIQESANGIQYVLFIGDDNKIPCANVTTPLNRVVKSDYWYGCFDGYADYEAEIPIGRFSTNTLSEFQNMVNKTVTYESSFDGYYDEVLLIAHYEKSLYNYQNCCDEIRNETYMTDLTFNIEYGDSVCHGGLESTNADVVNSINSGMHIVNYRGHGDNKCWGDNYMGWNIFDERFYDSEINNINTCSIYFNVCCNNGNITVPSSFMETFTRAQKGAIACLASTNILNTEPNHLYNKGLFSKLLNDNVCNIGYLSILSLIASFANPDFLAKAQENACIYLCGGDPSLEIWTDTPSSFTGITLTKSNGNIVVSCPLFISGDCISVISEDGELIGKYTITGNSYTLPSISGGFYISITRHNYYPYIVYYSDSGYIQNKTFTTNAYYDTTPMNVGYDVTTEESYGNVIVRPRAKLTIRNGLNGVTIKNGFECEKGGMLVIE